MTAGNLRISAKESGAAAVQRRRAAVYGPFTGITGNCKRLRVDGDAFGDGAVPCVIDVFVIVGGRKILRAAVSTRADGGLQKHGIIAERKSNGIACEVRADSAKSTDTVASAINERRKVLCNHGGVSKPAERDGRNRNCCQKSCSHP